MIEGKNPINVKEITISEPRSPVWKFDPQRDLGSMDWENMIHGLSVESVQIDNGRLVNPSSESPFLSDYLQKLQQLSFLSPQNRNEIGIDNEGFVESVLSGVHETKGKHSPEFELSAANFKLMYPHLSGLLKLDNEWEILRERHPQDSSEYAHLMALPLTILFPQHRAKIAPAEVFATLIADINEDVLTDVVSKTTAAAKLKLLFPDKFSDLLYIPSEQWKTLRIEFEKQRNATNSLRKFAYSLTILAADEARINNRGLIEIVMHKNPLIEDRLQVPERRRF
jgi:hypothetical protein